MALPRVIPVLLLRNQGLVKTVKFKEPKYVGDPINAIKIFNEKEVDELIFLDINASAESREPRYDYLKEIASECFMPLAYGGGVTNNDQIGKLIKSGIEKVVVNSSAIRDMNFLRLATSTFGSSTIVGAMDVKRDIFGNPRVYNHVRKSSEKKDPVTYALALQDAGVGEIFINDVDRDGTMSGYDLALVKQITEAVAVPVVACGGAGSIDDIDKVINQSGAAAAAAGSMFVFHGKHRAVLITYPEHDVLKRVFATGRPHVPNL